MTTLPPRTATSAPSGKDTLELARKGVRDMLLKSEAFRVMPPDQQREIAKNTVEIVNYLSAPEGIPANTLPNAQALAGDRDRYAFAQGPGEFASVGSQRKPSEFKAQAAMQGAKVAGVLLKEVNFPQFVGGLITNVFQAIVTSSIQQMEAYGKLVADVAKTLNQFRDENVSDNQGRDHLVDQFPDVFELSVDTGDFGEEGRGPRIRMREGVDEALALQKVNGLPIQGGPLKSLDMEDDTVEDRVVQAARTQLATSRQQLLATMVLMGINRIVVTDGKISAKVMYDFKASDRFKSSATYYDYANMGTRTVSEEESETQRQGPQYSNSPGGGGGYGQQQQQPSFNYMGGSFYSKGIYKTTEEPVVKITSAVAETNDAQLQAKATLAGSVEVNFKSDYFPLEKMADSFQIGMIQNASKPNGTAAAAAAPASGTPAPAATTPAPAPATTTPKA